MVVARLPVDCWALTEHLDEMRVPLVLVREAARPVGEQSPAEILVALISEPVLFIFGDQVLEVRHGVWGVHVIIIPPGRGVIGQHVSRHTKLDEDGHEHVFLSRCWHVSRAESGVSWPLQQDYTRAVC